MPDAITPWCPYCMKDVQEDDTDHAVDDDGELTDCNVYGRTVGRPDAGTASGQVI